jgi:hypothetical protein
MLRHSPSTFPSDLITPFFLARGRVTSTTLMRTSAGGKSAFLSFCNPVMTGGRYLGINPIGGSSNVVKS